MTDASALRPSGDAGRASLVSQRVAVDVPRMATSERVSVRERLEEIIGVRTPGEVALVRRITTSFYDQATGLLEATVAAAEAGDAAGARHHAHSLKGKVVNLGGIEVARQCQELEALARAGDCPAVIRLGTAVMAALAPFQALVDQVCGEFPELAAPTGEAVNA